MDDIEMVDEISYLKGAYDAFSGAEDSFIQTKMEVITRSQFIRFLELQKIAVKKRLDEAIEKL